MLAHFEFVLDAGDALGGDGADVEHAVDAGEDVDEGAEIFDTDDCTGVDAADFWLFGEGLDPVEGFLDGLAVWAGDGD